MAEAGSASETLITPPAPAPGDGPEAVGRTVPKPAKPGLTPMQNTLATEEVLNLRVTPEQLETLRKFHTAGIIDLSNALVLDTNEDSPLVTWTFEDVRKQLASSVRNGRRRKAYSPSTIEETINKLRQAMEHPVAPVRLRPPQEESWLEHFRYVTCEERKPEHKLENRRRALRRLVKEVFGLHWPSLEGTLSEPPRLRRPPTPDIVDRLTTLDPSEKLAWYRHTDANYRHALYFGFNVGVRPPSELVYLRLTDFRWGRFTLDDAYKARLNGDMEAVERMWSIAQRQPCTVSVRQPKKKWKVIPRVVQPRVVAARDRPSMFNYAVNWRARIHNRLGNIETDTVLVTWEGQTLDPKSWGQDLAAACRKIWPPFWNYSMRHYYAVERLISTYLETGVFDTKRVASDLGDTPAVVNTYYLPAADLRIQEILGSGLKPARLRRVK